MIYTPKYREAYELLQAIGFTQSKDVPGQEISREKLIKYGIISSTEHKKLLSVQAMYMWHGYIDLRLNTETAFEKNNPLLTTIIQKIRDADYPAGVSILVPSTLLLYLHSKLRARGL